MRFLWTGINNRAVIHLKKAQSKSWFIDYICKLYHMYKIKTSDKEIFFIFRDTLILKHYVRSTQSFCSISANSCHYNLLSFPCWTHNAHLNLLVVKEYIFFFILLFHQCKKWLDPIHYVIFKKIPPQHQSFQTRQPYGQVNWVANSRLITGYKHGGPQMQKIKNQDV